MTYEEIRKQAKENLDPAKCSACPVCNGIACRGRMPGPAARGTASSFTRNLEALEKIKLNIDTLYEAGTPDTSFDFFGRRLSLPVMCGPIGGVKASFGAHYEDDETYTMDLLKGCLDAGTLAFTGDAPVPTVYTAPMKAVKTWGNGIPTFKPRNLEDAKWRIAMAEENGAAAIAMDIDCIGLPPLRNLDPPVKAQTVEELAAMIALTDKPVIIKGILNPKTARKAVQAGAKAIVVSTHSGRVIDQLPAAAEVLPAIKAEVGDEVKVFADGGVRSGLDVFKYLALGADAVLIGRPYVQAVYGGGAEGAKVYTDFIRADLVNAMYMTGALKLSDITRDMILVP